MTVTLIYPLHGRGAWTGMGGTLNSDGTKPGIYYRAPSGRMVMPGLTAYRAVTRGLPVEINNYAVYMAIRGIQREIKVSEDGLFGPDTADQLSAWQTAHGLQADGVFGPTTARAMFGAMAINAGHNASTSMSVVKLTLGHTGFESSWDPGAVGYVVPRDLGLGQINGPSHPELTPEFRLSPRPALTYVAHLVLDNLQFMLWNERDAIAAYNLGVEGARAWVRAGRPNTYLAVDVAGYIDGVLAAADS